MESHVCETFHLMTAGAKTVDIRSNLIKKRYRVMKRAFQYFSLIFPSCETVGENSDCLQKSGFSQMNSGDLNIDLI